MKLEAKAQLKRLRIAPRKMRLLVDLIRGQKIDKAISQLQFSRKKAAKPLLKLLNSAIANAVNNHNLKKETLYIKTIFVNEGATLKRWMPRAMGRATPIRKRTSHTTIILEGEKKEEIKKKTVKKVVKKNDNQKKQIKTKSIKSKSNNKTK